MSKLILFTTSIITCGLIALLGVSPENSEKQEHVEEKTTAPDSVKNMIEAETHYDELKNHLKYNYAGLSEMPVFKPDTSLTQNMPILKTPPVDEDMIIPGF